MPLAALVRLVVRGAATNANKMADPRARDLPIETTYSHDVTSLFGVPQSGVHKESLFLPSTLVDLKVDFLIR